MAAVAWQPAPHDIALRPQGCVELRPHELRVGERAVMLNAVGQVNPPYLKMHRAITPDLQRQMAEYTIEAGKKLQTRGLFGSDRAMVDEMRQCVCGLCVRAGSMPQRQCSLFTDGGATLVVREQKEICKPVCVSKSSVRLLQRLIRTLLRDVAAAADSNEGPFRISLQRDDAFYEKSAHPRDMPPSRQTYMFDILFLEGELHLSFFAPLGRLHESQYTIPYRIGEHLELSHWVSERVLPRLKKLLDRALIEGDGKKYSMTLLANGLPERDAVISGIPWRHVNGDAFRARPVFLFLQAQARTFMPRKGPYPEQ